MVRVYCHHADGLEIETNRLPTMPVDDEPIVSTETSAAKLITYQMAQALPH